MSMPCMMPMATVNMILPSCLLQDLGVAWSLGVLSGAWQIGEGDGALSFSLP